MIQKRFGFFNAFEPLHDLLSGERFGLMNLQLKRFLEYRFNGSFAGCRLLMEVHHLAAEFWNIRVSNVSSIPLHAAAINRIKQSYRSQQNRFAASRCSGQRDAIARVDADGYFVQQRLVVAGTSKLVDLKQGSAFAKNVLESIEVLAVVVQPTILP